MERKFHQEKALREVAETRVKALKKKIRAYESNSTTMTNGSNSSVTQHNPNDTSIDAGYGTNTTGSTITGTTVQGGILPRDDESVGTNQTHDKLLPLSAPSPAVPYSDHIQ